MDPPAAAAAASTFTFHPPPAPSTPLSFTASAASSTPAAAYPRKRSRQLADIDGIDRDYSKKRRLRLHLVTSRLSAPFAVPPTNIPRAVACWARCSGGVKRRGVLRKAAILNKIKRDAMAAREAYERQVEAARRQFRERLAAAARASFQCSNVVRHHRPVDRRRPPPPPPPASPPQNTPSRSPSPYPASSFAALQISKPWGSNSSRGKDPYAILPAYRRPPSPPSESELNRQRRGMGLDIGCC